MSDSLDDIMQQLGKFDRWAMSQSCGRVYCRISHEFEGVGEFHATGWHAVAKEAIKAAITEMRAKLQNVVFQASNAGRLLEGMK